MFWDIWIWYAMIGGLVLAAALLDSATLRKQLDDFAARVPFFADHRWIIVLLAVFIYALLWPFKIPAAVRSVRDQLRR